MLAIATKAYRAAKAAADAQPTDLVLQGKAETLLNVLFDLSDADTPAPAPIAAVAVSDLKQDYLAHMKRVPIINGQTVPTEMIFQLNAWHAGVPELHGNRIEFSPSATLADGTVVPAQAAVPWLSMAKICLREAGARPHLTGFVSSFRGKSWEAMVSWANEFGTAPVQLKEEQIMDLFKDTAKQFNWTKDHRDANGSSRPAHEEYARILKEILARSGQTLIPNGTTFYARVAFQNVPAKIQTIVPFAGIDMGSRRNPAPGFQAPSFQQPSPRDVQPRAPVNSNLPTEAQSTRYFSMNRGETEKTLAELKQSTFTDSDTGRVSHQTAVHTWHRQHPNPGEAKMTDVYPLTPGTAPAGSGECHKCGRPGHKANACTSQQPVSNVEKSFRRSWWNAGRRIFLNRMGSDDGESEDDIATSTQQPGKDEE
ncbi:hypothetical protein RQP46_007853 [Phenoliferia psychrophenolica]